MSVNDHRRKPIPNTRELAALKICRDLEEAVGGRGPLAAPRVVGGAGEACLAQVWRASRRRMGAHGHERGCKGASPGSPRCSGSPRCF